MHGNSDIDLKPEQQLTADDWNNLEEIMSMLKPFKKAQKYFEEKKYANASLVSPTIKVIRKHPETLVAKNMNETRTPIGICHTPGILYHHGLVVLV